MTTKRDGGPAFPHENWSRCGMSLRDWFAGQALAGMLMNHQRLLSIVRADATQAEADAAISGQAYMHADAMLAARGADQ